MSGRLIGAIVSTIIYEAALAALVLWGLPQAGVQIPPGGLAATMLALAGAAVWMYLRGSQALRRKPLVRLPSMIDSTAKAVTRLDPEGTVKIKGELWKAKRADGFIRAGEEVIVIEQHGLELIVRKNRKPEG